MKGAPYFSMLIWRSLCLHTYTAKVRRSQQQDLVVCPGAKSWLSAERLHLRCRLRSVRIGCYSFLQPYDRGIISSLNRLKTESISCRKQAILKVTGLRSVLSHRQLLRHLDHGSPLKRRKKEAAILPLTTWPRKAATAMMSVANRIISSSGTAVAYEQFRALFP